MDRKVSSKQSLSVAADALQEQERSCEDRSATSGLLPPLPPCGSARGCQPWLLELCPTPPSHRNLSGLAQPTDLGEPTPVPSLQTNPSAFASQLSQEAPRADKVLCVTRTQPPEEMTAAGVGQPCKKRSPQSLVEASLATQRLSRF